MQDPFILVISIVAIVIFGRVAREYLRDRGAARADPNIAGEIAGELEAEIDRLRDRVEVLEKIVTDGKYQLNQELERL